MAPFFTKIEQLHRRAIAERAAMSCECMTAVWKHAPSAATARSIASFTFLTRVIGRTGIICSVQTSGCSFGTSTRIVRTSGPAVIPSSLRITDASLPMYFLLTTAWPRVLGLGATAESAPQDVGEGIQVTFASSMLYDFDSDVVLPTAAANLRNLAASLGKYPNTDVLIVGHTDATGSAEYNQGLSLRRATSAANYLIAQGVASTRVRTAGRGEMEPIATNDTEAGRQANRRVEIAIVANAAARKSGGN